MDVDKLMGLWFHSHEEDKGDRVVYRGRSYDFPRSRQPRHSMTLASDGMVAFGQPGSADAASFRSGTWNFASDVLTLSASGKREVYEIETLDEDILVLRRRVTEETSNGEEG